MQFPLNSYYLLHSASVEASHAKSETERLRYEVRDLQRKVDGLTIACQALWEIVRDEKGVRDDVLLAKMQDIDLRDGRADGKITAVVLDCPKCGHKSNSKRGSCLYCGTLMPSEHVFEKT